MRATRRVIVALVFLLAGLSITRRANADEPTQTPEPYEHRPDKPKPYGIHVSPSALMTFGSFVGIPVVRGGFGIEVRTRYLSGHGLFALGRTPNGLGAHRLEIGGNLTSGDGWLRASIGPHLGYAMLVRTTEQNAFVNAFLGDIASFAIGMHASIEVSIPITDRTRAFLGVRGMGELYRRRQGWELGPAIGLHF